MSGVSNDGAKAVVSSSRKGSSLVKGASVDGEHPAFTVTSLPKLAKLSKCQESQALTTASDRATNHGKQLIRPPAGNPPLLRCKSQPMLDPLTKVIMALNRNGLILDLCCNGFKIITSLAQPPSSNTPAVLHPSALQCAVPHFEWIDRFPFPRFRDNAILMADSVDLVDFVSDFYTMKSFSIKEEGCSWDPNAWLVDPGFHAKWRLLFK